MEGNGARLELGMLENHDHSCNLAAYLWSSELLCSGLFRQHR